jgi:virulence plasmid B protein
MASDPEHRPEDSRAAPWSAATASPPVRLADDTSFRISPPSISLPKGGGAIRGVGEKFAANPVTGSAGFSVPLPVSPGRGGFGPKLELSYDSGNGNGTFGFGWSLSLPSISRKTDKGLPLYADRTDTFLISGAEDLVPILDAKSAVEDDDTFAAGYVIRRYRPRIEGLFARIERWTRSDGDVHWRSISADNVLSTWLAGPSDQRRDQVIYYQYRHDRARRTLRGIDQQIAKAERAVAGIAPVKRNRFIHLSGGTRRVNRSLEAKARSPAGRKGYITNLDGVTPKFVIGAYHRLFQIEKSFRMAESDLAARPIYHRTRDSIETHLTIVFAALAISRWIEDTTGWSIKKFVKTARRYREIKIQAGEHVLTAADPLPADLRTAVEPSSSEPEGTNLSQLGLHPSLARTSDLRD